MDVLNKPLKTKGNSKVMDKLKRITTYVEYRWEKLNYDSLTNAVPTLLDSTGAKNAKYEAYYVGNRGYKLEVLKRPIVDIITLYKKSEDYDINLFNVEFEHNIFQTANNRIKIVNWENFFEETNISKEKLEKDINLIYNK